MAMSRHAGRGTDNELRIVLVGKTGAGKSATANSVLGHRAFTSSAASTSTTRHCQVAHMARFGRDIQVVDTPGLFDTAMTEEKVTAELGKCLGIVAPGPHAFFLVVQVGRFTDEEQKTVELFRQLFGADMVKYTIVVFTRKDDLDRDGMTLEDYVQGNPKLSALLESCGGRYMAINNAMPSDKLGIQTQLLIAQIDSMVEANGGTFYSGEMLKQAEAEMKKREQEKQKQLEEKKQKEMMRAATEIVRKQVEADYEAKIQEVRNNLRKEIEKEKVPWWAFVPVAGQVAFGIKSLWRKATE